MSTAAWQKHDEQGMYLTQFYGLLVLYDGGHSQRAVVSCAEYLVVVIELNFCSPSRRNSTGSALTIAEGGGIGDGMHYLGCITLQRKRYCREGPSGRIGIAGAEYP
jgi:hypothetical protein